MFDAAAKTSCDSISTTVSHPSVNSCASSYVISPHSNMYTSGTHGYMTPQGAHNGPLPPHSGSFLMPTSDYCSVTPSSAMSTANGGLGSYHDSMRPPPQQHSNEQLYLSSTAPDLAGVFHQTVVCPPESAMGHQMYDLNPPIYGQNGVGGGYDYNCWATGAEYGLAAPPMYDHQGLLRPTTNGMQPVNNNCSNSNAGTGATGTDLYGAQYMEMGRNNTFMNGYHSSPTNSSYTSTGSDEGEDIFGFSAKRPVSADFDPKSKRAKPGKKRKPKRDQNEPQKPVSAYALFFRDTQAAIKGQNPNATFGEVSKIVASMWDSIDADAKNIYKQKTEAAKKDYLKQLAAYRASLVSKVGGSNQSGSESFAEFSQSQRKLLSCAQMPDSTTGSGSVPDSANSNGNSAFCDVGEKSLASLIAAPTNQHVLTATTTLTVPPSYIPVRPKVDFETADVEPHSHDNGSICLRTGCGRPSVDDPTWDNSYCSTECVVTHCRDLFSSWVHSPTQHNQGSYAAQV